MFDARLVIGVLRALAQIQAIQRGAAILAVQHRVHVGAAELRTNGHREVHEVAVTPLMRFSGAHVRGQIRFALHLEVVHRRAVAECDLGDMVREVRNVGEGDEALEDRQRRQAVGHHERAREGRSLRRCSIGDVQDVHRSRRDRVR